MECGVIKMEGMSSPRQNDFLCISDCLSNGSQLRAGSAPQENSEQSGTPAKRKLNSNSINRIKMKRARATVQKTWKKPKRSFKRVQQFKYRESDEEDSLQKQVKEIKATLDGLTQTVQLQSSKIDILLHLMYTQKFGSNQPLQASSPFIALPSADKTENPQTTVQSPDGIQKRGPSHSVHSQSLLGVVDKTEISQVGHFSRDQGQLLPNTRQKSGSGIVMHSRSSPVTNKVSESPHTAVCYPSTEVQLLPDNNHKCDPSGSMHPGQSLFAADKTECSQGGHFSTAQFQLLPADTVQKCGSNPNSASMHSHPLTCSADKAENPQATMYCLTSQVQFSPNTIQKPSFNQSQHMHPSSCVGDKMETLQTTANFTTSQASQALTSCSDSAQNRFHVNHSFDSVSDEPTFPSSSRGGVHLPTSVSKQPLRVIHVGAPCATQPEAPLTPASNHMLPFNGEVCNNPREELVIVGGNQAIKMSRENYRYCTSGHKPTKVALRFVDTLVPKEVLIRSTVLGTREFERLDSSILDAIRAEVDRLFSHQCRNMRELSQMWDNCKTSIGKRCQRLRTERKNGVI